MSPYLFIFGNTPALSFLELSSIFPTTFRVLPEVALVSEEMDASCLMQRLGGTVKIARVIDMPKLTPESLASYLLQRGSSLSFGLSFYGRLPVGAASWASLVKSELGRQGVSSRFVLPQHGLSLSTVVVAKQKLVELVVVSTKEGSWLVGETVAVQDFAEWGKRDFGRPAPDPKAGMLPPKVARMIVNIALGEAIISNGAYRGSPFVAHPSSLSPSDVSSPLRKGVTVLEKTRRAAPLLPPKILLDPFCGVGTILAEALLLGCSVIGSDQSETAIEKARKNLKWLASQYLEAELSKAKLFVGEATHVSEQVAESSLDAIATEPFLGETSFGAKGVMLTLEKIKNTLKGLEKLYIGCLRDWVKILKPGGRVVMAFPGYKYGGKEYTVKTVVDRCETLGYTLLAGPIEYSRPQAVVRRQFYILQRKN